ncbi:hypothetical protein B0T26DRAFT_642955 [Lasiosphaeria miniovina]|uniref:Uncharacterized protein n=1 Tax=Lasiosphaeria miniovina TaxID=1954250 RepID=A0AA40AWQ5_9PEZI|nr:uncharacterized protein B0T26DRAFT_642955 [Lasiosphaeria miniovina]KAK0723398.1 hypothetical protein B0T26DRAFT_642955 [Lasiosphaeria miniovina]
MIWQTALVASLLASGAQAGIGSLVAEGMTRGNPSVVRRLQEIAKLTLVSRGFLDERQTPTVDSNTVFSPDGTINMTAWDDQANKACNAALKDLKLASNPSGAVICYNLPALNNVTGTFEADLRLYQLNEPTGDFAGIPPEKIQVGLTYKGASVSPVTSQTASTKVVAARQAAAGTAVEATGNGPLKLLQTYLFVGQIDKTQLSNPVDTARLQALVMPVVTLKANNTQGQLVSTNVSSNEAVFVTGIFSGVVFMSTFRMAELAVQQEVSNMQNGTSAFVVPGMQILIFPVGLIITGAWTLLGVAAYAYGTYSRYQFRDQFLKRMQTLEKSNTPRI